MNKKQIEKEYKEMLKKRVGKVAENRVNCYVCDCGHITKTIDVDSGVTPMFYLCEKCGSRATSSFYKDIAPELKPTQEWYRPTLEETIKAEPFLRNHILSGGLDVRKISV